MKPNMNRWSRQPSGGLYLIELRQRLAEGRSLRQLITVRAMGLRPLRSRAWWLEQFNPGETQPVEAA